MTRFAPALTAAVVGAFVPAPLFAQQFVHSSNALPGSVWTEGVEPADVDNDGDIDLFFADGDGFSSAGTKRQNRLYINKLEVTPNTWADESVLRLGTNSSNAKMAISGDVNGDGWIDAMFCNAFNTDRPFLYVNRGSSGPGIFVERGVQAGFSTAYSSASGQFGDLDNDGDLDLILCDSGSSFLGGSGDKPHLFFNDGSGIFTENAAALGAPTKKAHMDVQLVDIDGDFDLDFFGANRASNSGGNHYLMLNDGTGTFTDVSNLLPGTSTNVYEAEVGDLDNDSDLDLFFVSLSGFAEGSVRNNLNTGSLGFSSGSTLSGSDDNEVGLIDFDNDGDYDIAIGSLGSSEKLFRNNGNLSFSTVSSDFTSISDSTLDLGIADFDNDGDYDIVTAQGESNPGQFQNKIYLNTGSADTLAPVVSAIESIGVQPANGPWVVRAQVRDQVMDDGHDWVSASVDYFVTTAAGSTPNTAGTATRMAGGLWRFAMDDTAEGAGLTLNYTLTFTDWAGNSTTTGVQVVPLGPVCGIVPYGLAAGGANVLVMDAIGSTAPGSGFDVVVTAPGQPAVATIVAFGRDSYPFAGGTGLLDLANYYTLVVTPVVGSTATSTWHLPNNPSLIGAVLNFQAAIPDPSVVGGVALSNGVEIGICN
ncbi:FG-GAP repeat protein [Planctomycetes bacterium Pla163]|uniref:FG-GAP repeat protein n=1 Tax=Rohdeia mirabilis TaxID=2528008 RepID=A0A518CWV3_9BACT|nr:FG-GAP repeat protein [Planctomycetes bacterium Pla163]